MKDACPADIEDTPMLLSDTQIRAFLQQNPKAIEGVSDLERPFDKDTSVQPASLDLRVGRVFVPETPKGDQGSFDEPSSDLNLRPGETAVVETLETFELPSDYAAIAFPPDSMSKTGLLMTNPGHIDPGYYGKLKFTLINMGEKEHRLKTGEPIATLMLFHLSEKADADWHTRLGGKRGEGVTREMLARLSKDFMNVEERTKRSARNEVMRIGFFVGVATVILSGMAAGVTVIPSMLFAPTNPSAHDISSIEVKLQNTQKEVATLRNTVTTLQHRISNLQGSTTRRAGH